MAEERERIWRALGIEVDTEEESSETSSDTEESSAPTESDWLDDVDDFGMWFDDDYEGDVETEALEWDFENEEGDDEAVVSGSAYTERRMSEASSLIALNEFGLAEGSVHVAGKVEDETVAGLVARVVPTSPLLGLLDSEWLRQLCDLGQVTRLRAGETLFEEGDEGDSLFVVLSGGVGVEIFDRNRGELVRTATLRPGDFFGEAALLSRAVRSATLRAMSDVVGIELESDAVLTLVEHQPAVIKLLMRFFRARLVGSILHTAPLFQSMGPAQRRSFISHFRMREVAPDAMVVRAGDTVDGLYLVLDGELSVLGADDKPMYRLRRGDVFGERSLVDGFPATSSLRADERCWLLRLPRSEFLDALCKHPNMLEYVASPVETPAPAPSAADVESE